MTGEYSKPLWITPVHTTSGRMFHIYNNVTNKLRFYRQAWNFGVEGMESRMLTNEIIELRATFNTSCEQPGFTAFFTWIITCSTQLAVKLPKHQFKAKEARFSFLPCKHKNISSPRSKLYTFKQVIKFSTLENKHRHMHLELGHLGLK